MEGNNANIITSKQAMLFIMSIQIGIGISNISNIVVKGAKHDGWISIVLGGVCIILITLMISVLCKRFNGDSIIDINRKIFGRYIGFFLNFVLCIYLLGVTVINIRFMIFAIASWFFQRTPLWVLTIFVLIPSVYLAYYGLKGICRYNIVVYTVIILVITLLLSNLNKMMFTLIAPVGSTGVKILQTVPETGYGFMGFETLLFIFPFIKDKQLAVKYTVIAAIFTTLIFTAATLVCIGVFGEDMLSHRVYPIVGLARMVRFPIFERIDLYFLAAWIPGMIACINSYMFCLFNTCERVFGIRSGTKPSVPLLLILSMLIIIIGEFIKDINTVFLVSQFSGYVTLILGLSVPLMCFLLALVFRIGDKKHEG